MQAVALQRVFYVLLVVCNIFGWMGLHPVPYDKNDAGTFQKYLTIPLCAHLPRR